MEEKNTFVLPEGFCCSYTCWDCKKLDRNEYHESIGTLGYCSGYWCNAIRSYVKSNSDVSGCSSFESR